MTYVILYDGFDTEGWESVETLFAPSFEEDNIRIYPADHPNRATEINDIIDPNSRHTFIFMTMQKEKRRSGRGSLISVYRYKSMLERIRKEFPYCKQHQNILFVVDRIPKERDSGEYIDQDKEIALALDKFGYLEDDRAHTNLFTIDQIDQLTEEIYELVGSAERVNKDAFGKDIEAILEKCIAEKKERISQSDKKETYAACIPLLEQVKERFLEQFWKLDMRSYERRRGLIGIALKRAFSETIGIQATKKDISIITYCPKKAEDDDITRLSIASLLSLIANRHEEELKEGWFEVKELEHDALYLKESLERLAAVRLPELDEKKIELALHNIEQINHSVEDYQADEEVMKSNTDVALFYVKREERSLLNRMKNRWTLMESEIDKVEAAIIKAKKKIYDNPAITTEFQYSYQELNDEAHKAVKTKYSIPAYSRRAIDASLNEEPLSKYQMHLSALFRKVPSLGMLFLGTGVFFLIAFAISLIPYELWNGYSLTFVGAVSILLLLLIYAVIIFIYRRKVKALLGTFYNRMKKIQIETERWYESRVDEYKKTYETKLKHENRILCRRKLAEVEAHRKLWKLHHNKVTQLHGIAEDIAARLDMAIEPDEIMLPDKIIYEDPDKIGHYALFPGKRKVEEVVIDIKMVNTELYCHGIIRKLELERIVNGA